MILCVIICVVVNYYVDMFVGMMYEVIFCCGEEAGAGLNGPSLC